MTWNGRLAVGLLVLILPVPAFGQGGGTATINGTVADESRAVLPGASVTATDLGTGRAYQAVSDERGEYRLLNLAPGSYKVQAELSGFATVLHTNLELLVGQNLTLPFTLKLAAVEETVTVAAQAPLVDTQSAAVAGNVDRRQMENMPLSGRNWLELSMLVKGVTGNNVAMAPGLDTPEQFQVNLDGQQVTQRIGTTTYAGQGRVSRDAIAEFQIVTNMFEITQGRSLGIEVQAITKSGTNTFAGSGYGYFRSDKLNAADHVAKRVLPYQNQQSGLTFGGPIVRDKMQFFGAYEYEREPYTVFTQPPLLPGQSFSLPAKNTTHLGLGRVDQQFGAKDHLSVRWTNHHFDNPVAFLAGTSHPSQFQHLVETSANLLGTWSRVFNNNTVGELRFSYNRMRVLKGTPPEVGCVWQTSSDCAAGITGFVEPGRLPVYNFPGGLSIGPIAAVGQQFTQNNPEARYDLTWLKGSHSFKVGGSFLYHGEMGEWHNNDRGTFTFTSVPPDLNSRVTNDNWLNPMSWNFLGLEPYVQSFTQNFHKDFVFHLPRPLFGMWFGDTWRVNNQLTLNYGVRWDDDLGYTDPPGITENDILLNNGRESGNFGFRTGIRDHNNVAPRGSFAYNVGGTGRLVIRGGSGLFYSEPSSVNQEAVLLTNQAVSGEWLYDGRPGFMQDPRRGVTHAQMMACLVAANCAIPLPPQVKNVFSPEYKVPYTWQNSLGFQKQIGAVTGFDADLVHWIWYNDRRIRDPNLIYDPSTGYQMNPRTAGRPNPAYGTITWYESAGRRDYLALASSLTRRLRNRLQAGLTHTLMFYYHDDNDSNNYFAERIWARATEFQRNTVRTYAIYQLPMRFSVSGVYFYGSGNYFPTTHASTPYGKAGTNLLNLGAPVTIPASVANRFEGPSVICTGCLVPRNALRGLALHRVDLRISKEFPLAGSARVSLIGEIFNLFDRANFGSYVVQVNAPTFGQPSANTGNAYAPRRGQLAVHLTF